MLSTTGRVIPDVFLTLLIADREADLVQETVSTGIGGTKETVLEIDTVTGEVGSKLGRLLGSTVYIDRNERLRY